MNRLHNLEKRIEDNEAIHIWGFSLKEIYKALQFALRHGWRPE